MWRVYKGMAKSHWNGKTEQNRRVTAQKVTQHTTMHDCVLCKIYYRIVSRSRLMRRSRRLRNAATDIHKRSANSS